MKTSTLLTMVTLSASCFAAPVHTATDSTSANSLAERANAAPVAPAAPDVAVTDDNRPQQWQFIALPKSRHLERSFTGQNEHPDRPETRPQERLHDCIAIPANRLISRSPAFCKKSVFRLQGCVSRSRARSRREQRTVVDARRVAGTGLRRRDVDHAPDRRQLRAGSGGMSGKSRLTPGSSPGSCSSEPRAAADWIHRSPHSGGASGIERIEAFFHHAGYAMHRHDTYAIGRTLAGVQSFRYRGSMRNSLPGGTMVLHPDEPHDGQAGTRDGFHYRMIYVDPALFQQALGGKPLPFLEGGLSNDPRLFAAQIVSKRNFEALKFFIR